MARTGRPRKPTVLKLLAGNPGKRKVNRREPKIRDGAISIPSHLGAVAKAEWRRLVKHLPRGLVTPADRAEFAQYCQTWARVCEAEKMLDQSGLYFVSENGYPCQHPLVSTLKGLNAQLRGYAADLGLNPSVRSKIEIPDQPAQDPTEDLLFGNRRSS
jgi:P27 family predicted phage terminase small subunit